LKGLPQAPSPRPKWDPGDLPVQQPIKFGCS